MLVYGMYYKGAIFVNYHPGKCSITTTTPYDMPLLLADPPFLFQREGTSY
jgi:hypothetical protein